MTAVTEAEAAEVDDDLSQSNMMEGMCVCKYIKFRAPANP